jgi:hypothetical protein
MQEGKVLFLDDATLISPAVLAVAYPAMDCRREITVKAHKGEVIKAADGFYVVAGHNPGVHGAILTEALSSRFSCQVKVSTDYDLAHHLKIDPAPSRPPGISPAGRPGSSSRRGRSASGSRTSPSKSPACCSPSCRRRLRRAASPAP